MSFIPLVNSDCSRSHNMGFIKIITNATAAAPYSSINLPSENLSKLNGALILCGSSLATVCANTFALPGVALNPPVPHPQLKYKP